MESKGSAASAGLQHQLVIKPRYDWRPRRRRSSQTQLLMAGSDPCRAGEADSGAIKTGARQNK
ncbi:hypothetical protein CR492_04090 [Methylocella silvestris]|uniref:Uncharacterized protein n=1 Tax=Methylocella silvestris TaxID=199596 RepID=A0A2J7TKM1_METSI|nr:hypothetical protein CR492_04090 [Methylocella silvestris]